MRATVLIPNYNNALFLNECLDSIKSQTFSDFDVLIIDDCSTDNSIEVINNHDFSRVKVIKKETNSGIIDTLNIGLKLISSEYIIRMDGDDIMYPNRVEKLINFMDKNDKFGACGSGIEHFGISNQRIVYEKNEYCNKANLVFQHTIGHATSIYRNSVLKTHDIKYSKGYNFIEDYKFFYDLSKITFITSIPDILYLYRREDYNNFKNLDIKDVGYKKIYSQILKDLDIKASEKNIDIHHQISHRKNLDYSYKSYREHCDLLLRKNMEIKRFPHKEFQKIISKKMNILHYHLIDQNKLNLSNGLTLFISRPKLFYYFFKSKLGKI